MNKHAKNYALATVIALSIFGVLYFTGHWPEASSAIWSALTAIFSPILIPLGRFLSPVGDWMIRHDTTIDLATVWALCIGFALFGVTKALSWWTLRTQDDATMVGVTLKRQKVAELLIGMGMAALYGMTLIEYYVDGRQFDFMDRFFLRSSLFIIMVVGSAFCILFVYYLRRESRSGHTGSIPLTQEDEE